ncbi:AI-2E family transporter [Hyphococcus sp.]|jgi:predicted PurR-regulated permease PerM|uniref:AI-2E family transporter n=1 Tax=Hyphococcus sp. TaxID=2038636 RepID=UPI003D113B16
MSSKRHFIDDVCPEMFTPRRSLQIIAGCALFLAVLATGFFLYVAKPVMLPLTTALVISIILAPAATRFVRFGFSQTAAAGFVTLIAVASIASLLVFSGRPAIAWAENIPELALKAREKLAGLEEAVSTVKEVSDQVEEIAKIGEEEEPAPAVAVKEAKPAASVTKAAPGAVVQFLFTWVLVFFLLAERNDFKRKLVAANRSMTAKLRAVRMFSHIEKQIGVYMLTMTTINACLGVCMGLAAWALDLPSPHIWGLLAAIFNFIPFIGPAVLTALLALAGIVHYEEPWMALAPAAAFMALNFIESNFATPMILGVRMRVTPLAIIVSVSLLTFLWGPLGGVLAIPLLLVLKSVCDTVPVLGPVGVLIGELKRIENPLTAQQSGGSASRRVRAV